MRRDIPSKLWPYLNNDEHLLWTGEPKKGVVFRKSDYVLIPFSLIWFTFSAFWTIGVSQVSGWAGLFGLPFLLIGIYLLIGRFYVDMRQRANTFNGLTENRILIKIGSKTTQVKSFYIDRLYNINYIEKRDRSGIISISDPETIARQKNNRYSNPELAFIPNVKKGYDQILELQNKG